MTKRDNSCQGYLPFLGMTGHEGTCWLAGASDLTYESEMGLVKPWIPFLTLGYQMCGNCWWLFSAVTKLQDDPKIQYVWREAVVKQDSTGGCRNTDKPSPLSCSLGGGDFRAPSQVFLFPHIQSPAKASVWAFNYFLILITFFPHSPLLFANALSLNWLDTFFSQHF